MFGKRKIRDDIKKIQRVKTWHLIVLLVLTGFLAATFLRLNNIGMVERRNAVISADEVGDSEVIKDRLYDLQNYVSLHMNTDLGQGVYLESSYKRDVEAVYQSVQNDSEVYRLVQDYCKPRFSHWSQAYVQCVANKIAEYPQTAVPDLPSASVYIHDFVSPLWSADFAGLSLLVCIVLTLVILIRIISYLVLRAMLKHRNPII